MAAFLESSQICYLFLGREVGAACILYRLVILSALHTSGSNLLVLKSLLKFKQPRGCACDCIDGLEFLDLLRWCPWIRRETSITIERPSMSSRYVAATLYCWKKQSWFSLKDVWTHSFPDAISNLSWTPSSIGCLYACCIAIYAGSLSTIYTVAVPTAILLLHPIELCSPTLQFDRSMMFIWCYSYVSRCMNQIHLWT